MDITVIPLQEKDFKPLFTNPEELGFGRFSPTACSPWNIPRDRLAEPDHPQVTSRSAWTRPRWSCTTARKSSRE